MVCCGLLGKPISVQPVGERERRVPLKATRVDSHDGGEDVTPASFSGTGAPPSAPREVARVIQPGIERGSRDPREPRNLRQIGSLSSAKGNSKLAH